MSSETEPTGNVIRLNVGAKDGRLSTPVGSHIPVRVYERGDFMLLVLMLDAAEELMIDAADDFGQAEPLLLEYVSPRGLVRFHGQTVLEGRDLVRFEVSGEPEVTQRREFVRVAAAQDVMLTDGSASAAGTYAIDISGGGMLLSGADRLELDALVRFTLNLGAGMEEISGLARVVRADGEGRRALVFEQISADDRQRLIHFVFERQRDALAKLGRVTKHRRAR